MRSLIIAAVLIGTGVPVAIGHSETIPVVPPAHQPEAVELDVGTATLSEEEASVLRIAENKTASGDYETAEIAFRQLLAASPHPERDQRALLGLARLHRHRGQDARAAALYEKLLQDAPQHPAAPTIYLELARTLRGLGAYDLAIGRFYSVINTTLNFPSRDASRYRQLARTAQFEVAETHLMAGRPDEAVRLFERLLLLDLSPEDQGRARLLGAHAHAQAGRTSAAAALLAPAVAEGFGTAPSAEALHLQASLLLQLQRPAEALNLVKRLLASEYDARHEKPERWRQWQRRAGNQLANEFYERGEIHAALTLYHSLAAMNERSEWRSPILYQIGLCYERLAAIDSAIHSYREVIAAGSKAADQGNLADLTRMAAWRIRHVEWLGRTQKDWQQLLPQGPETTPHATQPAAQALTEASPSPTS
jgi:tetratricopeptide (TPR) repeat protein